MTGQGQHARNTGETTPAPSESLSGDDGLDGASLNLERLYRHEISAAKFKALSAQEERALLDRIQLGRSPGREGGIQFTADALNARDELLESKLQMVMRLALPYLKFCGANVSHLDLVQAGNVGLIQAVERYDGDRGASFDTFAFTRIRGAILDLLREARATVRPARSVGRVLNRIEEVIHKFSAEHGRSATSEEIVELVYRHELKKLERNLGRPATEEEKAQKLNRLSPEIILNASAHNVRVQSLDAPLEDEQGNGGTFGENFAVEGERDPVSALAESLSLRAELNKALRELPMQHEQVLRLVTGFLEDGTDAEPMTLKAIGDIWGISESRTSQIFTAAISRLRGRDSILRLMKSY